MYTHARQFPHLNGLSDHEIRKLAHSAMIRHPNLIRMMRFRNAALYLSMIVAAALLGRYSNMGLGIVLVSVGLAATAFVLLWNLIWLNFVLFRITRDEVERGRS